MQAPENQPFQADRHRTSRRTFLRGVGVAMALPWLESIPVWGSALARDGTPGPFPRRFAALFMGNGINSKHWWAKGSGADMELGKSLASRVLGELEGGPAGTHDPSTAALIAKLRA